MRERGFTLLEVLVATTLMAVAVAGLMGNLRTSLSNASRLTDYDRAALLARRQMDELLAARGLPKGMPLEGEFPARAAGGVRAGWRARILPFESAAPPGVPPAPGSLILDRIELEVWWAAGQGRKSLKLAAYRRGLATPADAQLFPLSAAGGAAR
jgi:general secretion pathway protein I